MNFSSSYLRTPLTSGYSYNESTALEQSDGQGEVNINLHRSDEHGVLNIALHQSDGNGENLAPEEMQIMKSFPIPNPDKYNALTILSSAQQDLNSILEFADKQFQYTNPGHFKKISFEVNVKHDLILEPTHLLLDNDLDDIALNNNLTCMAKGPLSPLDDRFSLIAQFCANVNNNGGIPPPNPIYGLLRACGQYSIIPMELVFNHLKHIAKISEGAYGEVFAATFTENNDVSIYKVVPVDAWENRPKAYSCLHYEIFISKLLNTLRDPTNLNYTTGFVKFYRARLLEGKYPQSLINARSQYKMRLKSPQKTNPIFKNSQQYLILEYEPSGTTVMSYPFNNAKEMYHVLLQVTFAMATAEAQLNFKHNDLHLGNVLVSTTSKETRTYKINGTSYKIPTKGLKATIIDFSLARCPKADQCCPEAHKDVAKSNNLWCSVFSSLLHSEALKMFWNKPSTQNKKYIRRIKMFQSTLVRHLTLVQYVNSDECHKYLA